MAILSMRGRMTAAIAVIAALAASACRAHDTQRSPACADEAHRGFDFWLGDWQVFDAKTGELAGFDRITRTLDGCAVRQEWTQFKDEFRPDGADARLRGESLFFVMKDGRWRQTWVDTSGFSVQLSGGYDPETDEIVLDSEAAPYPGRDGGFVSVFFRWRWRANEDGTVRSWGFTKVTEDGEWEPSFDNIYRPNR